MTLKQRIRYLMDGLAAGAWLSLAEIRERLPDLKPDAINTAVSTMWRSEQLKRRGPRRQYEYRSGARPTIAKGRGMKSKPPERLGFMALSRLSRTDPVAYRKALAADRRRA